MHLKGNIFINNKINIVFNKIININFCQYILILKIYREP